jgi:peptidoglycan/xylan/chitin deacetylase (PgdA/CDA1 family)
LNGLPGRLTILRDRVATVRAILLCWRARLSARRAGITLVYHRVGGDTSGDPSREILPALSSAVFARQLRHFRRHYRIVRAQELLDAVRSRRRGARFPVCITFDDDLATHVREALPALQQAGVTATFFVGGVSFESPHSFWWQDLQRAVDERLVTADAVPQVAHADLDAALAREPKAIFRVAAAIERLAPSKREEAAAVLRAAVGARAAEDPLTAADVRTLVAGGCDVGFHTLRHEALPLLDDDTLEQALRDGRDALDAVVGSRLDAISYPHGKADDRVAAAARAAGFSLGFVTGARPVTADTEPLLVPRIPPAPSPGKTALRVARAVASSTSR